MDNKADLSIGVVATAPSPATSGTSLTLEAGQGDIMPDTPFKALAYPPGQVPTRVNAEIIRVTEVSGDTLTITRGLGVTEEQSIDEGWIISNNVFADDFVSTVSTVVKGTVTGSVNGTNKAFTCATPYAAGTLQVYVNGLAQSNYVTETDPADGEFELDEAPLTGDNIRVSYQYMEGVSGNADTLDGEHLSTILEAIYPVGSVFISGSSSMPTLIDSIGTWTRLNGRVIVGLDPTQTEFDTIDETGGSKTHNHTTDVRQTFAYSSANGLQFTNGGTVPNNPIASSSSSNLPPYKVKYMWERTA